MQKLDAIRTKSPDNESEPSQTEEQTFATNTDCFERPITVREKVYATYSEFMEACEQYPDDEEYEDEEYEYEDDDDEEQVYITSTDVSKQPMSIIEGFLKNHEILYPENQEHIWEDDLPAEYRVNKSLVKSINQSCVPLEKTPSNIDKNGTITKSAYMIQQDNILQTRNLQAVSKIKLKRALLRQCQKKTRKGNHQK